MPDPYRSIAIDRSSSRMTVTLHRPQRRNSIDDQMLAELHRALDDAERDEGVRLLVIKGQPGTFCTGMDFDLLVSASPGQVEQTQSISSYMRLLRRYCLTSRVIITCVDGTVMAGGVGLVAASDLAFASSRTTFALSEALWGLLPAQVMPFLIRRVGFQPAYRMTLTTQSINATEARAIGLVDTVSAGDPGSCHDSDLEELMRPTIRRLVRLEPQTITDLKAYMRTMWLLSDDMEQRAVAELGRLMNEERVQGNIRNYVTLGQLPWENR